jgi:hypothetical protein
MLEVSLVEEGVVFCNIKHADEYQRLRDEVRQARVYDDVRVIANVQLRVIAHSEFCN